MLQNRVDPFGDLMRTTARGSWMGNRGVIHNDQQEIIRAFKLKAWITCVLEFKGRKRKVMSRDRYTELFFLDEATAFSAGHRPCAECRRNDYNRFKSSWLKGNPGHGFDEKVSVQKIDAILDSERIEAHNTKITFEENIRDLPNGVFVLFKGNPFLILNRRMYLWSPFGYPKEIKLPHSDRLPVLTPRSIVNTFRAGYEPQITLNV